MLLQVSRAAAKRLLAVSSANCSSSNAVPAKNDIDKLFQTENKVQNRSSLPSINRIEILGNIGSIPEWDTLEDGRSCVKFQVLTNRGQDEFFRHYVSAFGRVGDFVIKNLKKNHRVHVVGHMAYRNFSREGSQPGRVPHVVAEVISGVKDGRDYEPRDAATPTSNAN